MNTEPLAYKVIEFTEQLGSYLLKERKNLSSGDVELKGVHDLVTKYDKHAEKEIVDFLSGLIPNAGFIAEEGTSTKKGNQYQWIIDPIDGTTNFVHGLPCFSISIALQKEKELIFGIVYEMNLAESFFTFEKDPTYLNGKEITVTQTDVLESALIATGFPYTDFEKANDYLKVFDALIRKSRGVRRLGSAAVDLAYVAAGRFEGFYEYGLNPWDVAAGALLVKNAGGLVTDFSRGDNFLFGKELVASNRGIYEPLTAEIEKYFS